MNTITIPLVPVNFVRRNLVAQGIVSIHEIDSMLPSEVKAVVARGVLHVRRTPTQCEAARLAYLRATGR